MKKNIIRILILLLASIPCLVYSQTTLFYFEDFEAPNSSLIKLNVSDSTGFGNHNGPNQWVINNKYTGQPIYPNTIKEDSTFGGAITHADSNYLHIHDVNVTAVG